MNSFWVGRYLGEAALTAVANAQSIILLLTGAALGLSMAATILVGQFIGAGKIIEAKRVASTGAIVFLAISVAMSIGGILLARPLLLAMNTQGELLALALPYTKVMFLALPILFLHAYLTSIVVGTGDSKAPLCSVAAALSVGIVLNPLLMFGSGPVPGAGIVGSALATLIAQGLSLAVLVQRVYQARNPLCFYKSDLAMLRVDRNVVGALVRKGAPMGAQLLSVSLSAVLMIALVNRFGVDTAAAYSASLQLWNYIQLPALAISVAVSSMAAQSVGAQDWERVRRAARVGVVSCTLATGATVLLVYAADNYAYRLFLPDDSPALLIASDINRVVLWSFVFLTIAVVLFGVMRGTGAVAAPLLIHSLSLFAVRFPLALLLINRWQADAIWWSFSISCAIDFLLAALYYRYGRWQDSARIDIVARLAGAGAERSRTRSIC